jgi:hypothetical protein
LTSRPGHHVSAPGLAIRPDCKIIAVGNSANSATGQSFIALARNNPKPGRLTLVRLCTAGLPCSRGSG